MAFVHVKGTQNSPALSILALPRGNKKSGLMASSDISNCTPYITSFSRTTTAMETGNVSTQHLQFIQGNTINIQQLQGHKHVTQNLAVMTGWLDGLFKPSNENAYYSPYCSPYISSGTSEENLSKYQGILSLVITSVILITWMFE